LNFIWLLAKLFQTIFSHGRSDSVSHSLVPVRSSMNFISSTSSGRPALRGQDKQAASSAVVITVHSVRQTLWHCFRAWHMLHACIAAGHELAANWDFVPPLTISSQRFQCQKPQCVASATCDSSSMEVPACAAFYQCMSAPGHLGAQVRKGALMHMQPASLLSSPELVDCLHHTGALAVVKLHHQH
jgi:hypothetical protein